MSPDTQTPAERRIEDGLQIGEDFTAAIPESALQAVTIAIVNGTKKGFTAKQLKDLVWSQRYQALYHYNRSPWVERGYSAPIADVVLVDSKHPAPAGAWLVELLDVSTEPGALGWHEDVSKASKVGPAGVHSARGKDAATEVPKAVVFCKTSRDDGVAPGEVASHEICEMIVDPWVMVESEIRVYPNPADGYEYIGEVGDPVQGRGYDVGAPEGRPCGVPEAIVADLAYPGWWGQPQRRAATCFCDDQEAWKTLPPVERIAPFTLATAGYMSRRKPGGGWEQIYGSSKAKAEAAAHAFERPGEVG